MCVIYVQPAGEEGKGGVVCDSVVPLSCDIAVRCVFYTYSLLERRGGVTWSVIVP